MTLRRRQLERQFVRARYLGVAALLVVAAVAYIAYDALNGLPLQSRYGVTVEVADADRLIAASDVKIAGVRVGQVRQVDASPATVGHPAVARLKLSLNKSVGELPVDTGVRVRSASPLGATYVELTPGDARTTIPEGGILRRATTPASPDLSDLFEIFDRASVRHFQGGVMSLAGGLAGRGTALNTIVGSLSALVGPLTRVSSVLASGPTRLGRFLRVYADTIDALAPVAPQIAGIFSNGATTFGAIAAQRRSLNSALLLAPGTERSATVGLRAVRPALDHLATLTMRLRPAVRHLPAALAAFNAAVATGTPVLRAVPPVAGPARKTLDAVTVLTKSPPTDGAVRKLTATFDAANTTLVDLLPAQLQCNLIPLFFQEFSSYAGSIGVGAGPSLLNIVVDRGGAQGDEIQSAAPAPDLHVDYLPNENRNECEAGNEPFQAGRRALSNPPGLQSARTRETSPPPHVLDLARSAGLLASGGAGR